MTSPTADRDYGTPGRYRADETTHDQLVALQKEQAQALPLATQKLTWNRLIRVAAVVARKHPEDTSDMFREMFPELFTA